MFNSDKIKELSEIIKSVKRENMHLNNRLMQLEHPCNHKVGDKFKDGVVIKIEFNETKRIIFTNIPANYCISWINTKTKQIETFYQHIQRKNTIIF